jgi:hypothetical protein
LSPDKTVQFPQHPLRAGVRRASPLGRALCFEIADLASQCQRSNPAIGPALTPRSEVLLVALDVKALSPAALLPLHHSVTFGFRQMILRL